MPSIWRRSIISYTRVDVLSSVSRVRITGIEQRGRQQPVFRLSSEIKRMSSSSSSSSSRYYDSHGDYQADDASGEFFCSNSSPLYREQGSLPKLPVSSIADTIERLKPSCLALVSNQNDKQHKKEQNDFLKACKEFPEQAKELQRLLEDRAMREDNWLQSWWNQIGYLGVRDPSPINVNYIFNFPKANRNLCQRINPLERGAKLLHSVYAFSEMVRSGELPQDRFGKQQTPLCSSMWKYMFYSCRIPKQGQDLYRIYNYSYHKDYFSAIPPKHAVVSARGHYFSVDLIDPSDGRPYSVHELKLALQECMTQASLLDENCGSNTWKNLGILTTTNRDEWASNRSFLIDSVHGMQDAMSQLESGLVLLCLESDDTLESLSQNSRSYLMGTQGRWYDKSIQFIMTPSGNLGLNGEHSMMDGMPAVRLQNYILEQELVKDSETDATAEIRMSPPPLVKPIFASQTIMDHQSVAELESINSMKNKAASDFDKVRDSLDLEVQSFRGYGSNWIKKHGKCSPDAYVQMSIQLAMAKLSTAVNTGSDTSKYVPMATYESTQVRPFKYGRTETTRSVSVQSVEWVEAMVNGKRNTFGNDQGENVQSLIALFHKATDAHVDYIRKASKGIGVDRHLFGLQMILAEHQGKNGADALPEVTLFRDPLFVRSKQWLISTSTLPSNPGFGPVVVPEGVGIAYDVQADSIYFTCTSYKGLAPALSHYLEESLLEVRELMVAADNYGRSKL